MFKDLKELNNFLIFLHTHYEVNDVWNFKDGGKGINFEGWHSNPMGNDKYCPSNLDNPPPHNKRTSIEDIYKTWKKVNNKRWTLKISFGSSSEFDIIETYSHLIVCNDVAKTYKQPNVRLIIIEDIETGESIKIYEN